MAYICLDCGHIFEFGEEATKMESRGEYWGVPCFENVCVCPKCHGEFEESVPCEICGSEHYEDDLSGGLCDECIDKYKHDLDICFKIGSNDTDKVELNCFLASIFDKEEIEKLLFRELKEREKYMKELLNYDYEKFVESDRGWFAERLLEELEKEKK